MPDDVTTTPEGWYPDPGGQSQWRRWEGTTWGTDTMPYGPPPPDAWSVTQERGSWLLLRTIAPWGLLAPGMAAAALAAESVTFGPLRRWYHASTTAIDHGKPLPPLPTTSPSPPVVTITYLITWFLMLLGVGAWLRYTLASTRLSKAAGYPLRHGAGWSCTLFFVPFVGPYVAYAASSEWLPAGHEARGVLARGWTFVFVGQLGLVALLVTTVATSSLTAAWVVAAASALAWLAAAIELPRGLEAVADDHASLGVRRAAAPS
jgi:hypothetical protein